jgi:hypothetical protein
VVLELQEVELQEDKKSITINMVDIKVVTKVVSEEREIFQVEIEVVEVATSTPLMTETKTEEDLKEEEMKEVPQEEEVIDLEVLEVSEIAEKEEMIVEMTEKVVILIEIESLKVTEDTETGMTEARPMIEANSKVEGIVDLIIKEKVVILNQEITVDMIKVVIEIGIIVVVIDRHKITKMIGNVLVVVT